MPVMQEIGRDSSVEEWQSLIPVLPDAEGYRYEKLSARAAGQV
jgi:hypothetical protein